MADSKISALPASTTPLTGTEVLPIVQAGVTVKIPTNDLTVCNIRAVATTGILQVSGPTAATTRTVTVPDANWTAARTDAAQSFTGDQTLATDNLRIGASGKGITTSGAIPLGLGVNNAVNAITIDTSSNVGVGTTTPTSGAMTNAVVLNSGIFATLRGSIASVSGTAVTIAVANQNYAQATYIVSCGISSAAPSAYSAVAIVSADNNTLRATTLQSASLMAISVSGTNIQATQSSGGAINIIYTLTRVA